MLLVHIERLRESVRSWEVSVLACGEVVHHRTASGCSLLFFHPNSSPFPRLPHTKISSLCSSFLPASLSVLFIYFFILTYSVQLYPFPPSLPQTLSFPSLSPHSFLPLHVVTPGWGVVVWRDWSGRQSVARRTTRRYCPRSHPCARCHTAATILCKFAPCAAPTTLSKERVRSGSVHALSRVPSCP